MRKALTTTRNCCRSAVPVATRTSSRPSKAPVTMRRSRATWPAGARPRAPRNASPATGAMPTTSSLQRRGPHRPIGPRVRKLVFSATGKTRSSTSSTMRTACMPRPSAGERPRLLRAWTATGPTRSTTLASRSPRSTTRMSRRPAPSATRTSTKPSSRADTGRWRRRASRKPRSVPIATVNTASEAPTTRSPQSGSAISRRRAPSAMPRRSWWRSSTWPRPGLNRSRAPFTGCPRSSAMSAWPTVPRVMGITPSFPPVILVPQSTRPTWAGPAGAATRARRSSSPR